MTIWIESVEHSKVFEFVHLAMTIEKVDFVSLLFLLSFQKLAPGMGGGMADE